MSDRQYGRGYLQLQMVPREKKVAMLATLVLVAQGLSG